MSPRSGRDGRATSSSRASSIQPMRDVRSTSAPTPSGSRTMAAVSSKPRRRRSAACRRSPPRSAMRCRSCSTPVSVRGPTSPGRSAGADFVFAGRPFYFGLGALGADGAGHALRDPPRRPAERDAPDRLCPPGRAARTDRLTVVGAAQAQALRVGVSTGWTYCQPKRPLMQSIPLVTEWSAGDVTFTILSSWVCSSRLQPTPQ